LTIIRPGSFSGGLFPCPKKKQLQAGHEYVPTLPDRLPELDDRVFPVFIGIYRLPPKHYWRLNRPEFFENVINPGNPAILAHKRERL
jgi:hypothetical protein